jgi:hypothetical protein
MSFFQPGENDTTKLGETKGSEYLSEDLTLLNKGLIQTDYMGGQWDRFEPKRKLGRAKLC